MRTMPAERIRIGIFGASGYTGAELLRLLGDHPRAEIRALTAERQAGRHVGEVHPQLALVDLPQLVKIDEVDVQALDVVFCCLPHGTTQEIIRDLPRGPKVVDLSADFRLRDADQYELTYGHAHSAIETQRAAVYGLTEHYREAIRRTWLVANPGCYTTCSELPLIPLLQAGAIDPDAIIVDAKSGVSGAGRDAKLGSLFTEVTEGAHAYGVATHRHTPEIEQCLADFAGRPIRVIFTPHLMPMSRGLLSTIYVRLRDGVAPEDVHQTLAQAYREEPFSRVLPYRTLPATRHVRGSNLCLMGVSPARQPGQAIIVSALDNLVKGASGQAVQNMNVQLGIAEDLGLRQRPLFP
jgi:N-acetyl-gamma-glutamyl-phosphate reductase